MAPERSDDPVWHDELASTSGSSEEEEELTPEQIEQKKRDAQLLDWYRRSCQAMGLGLAASVFQNFMRAPPEDTFLPPRASFFDPDALARWRKYQVFRTRMARVGRQTLFFGGVAGLYFGVETAGTMYRGVRDPWNQAAGGVVTGAVLGCLLPGPLRPRSVVLYAAAGGSVGLVTSAAALALQRLQSALPDAPDSKQQ